MKIRDILASKTPTISFEIFPPNARMSLGQVMAAAAAMSVQKPDFMSVTYGAAGGTKENTVKIATSLQEFLGIPSIAHLTCVATEKERVKAIALEMKNAGIENVLALRGDRVPEAEPSKDFLHATDLISYIKANGDFDIAAACYPEGHPDSDGVEQDILYVKRKVAQGTHTRLVLSICKNLKKINAVFAFGLYLRDKQPPFFKEGGFSFK